GHRLRGREAGRHEAVRPVLLGDDGPRFLPAVQPVRGGVQLGSAHRGAAERGDRRGAGGARRGEEGLNHGNTEKRRTGEGKTQLVLLTLLLSLSSVSPCLRGSSRFCLQVFP